MSIEQQVAQFIASLPEPKRGDMETIHSLMLEVLPGGKLWFDNGKDSENKTINNPTIGYGTRTIHYANGTTKVHFQIGLSANATGISVYILGIADKAWLAQTYSQQIGKAKVTGYCIRFKKLTDISLNVLEAAMRSGVLLSQN